MFGCERCLPRAVVVFFALLLSGLSGVDAHPIAFNSTILYEHAPPAVDSDDLCNWVGAAFDAENLCGSGVNADGGDDNGTANDACTYVASNQPVQGQTFTTGAAPHGYDLHAITVRMAGYTNNNASGANGTAWDLEFTNGPILVSVQRVNGDSASVWSQQAFMAGGLDNPGAGRSANGAGDYITFELPFHVHLEPDAPYGFDFAIGNGGGAYFEWLGIAQDAYDGGAAYTRSGAVVTPLAGDRVFMLDLTPTAAAAAPFHHPGTLHTQEDLDRMAAKVAAGAEPWSESYNILAGSPYAQLSWTPAPMAAIVRGGSGNNYTRSQQDAQAIYELALRWHITGDTEYADRAVYIANAWSAALTQINGDTNASLAAGICGYLFAIGGDLLSTYPGWAEPDKQAFKDMMLRVFYPRNFDFLWRHHDTFWRTGGNTHYRLNWDAFNMASMAAIGILCDNRAVYEQAVDYFKHGPGNGRIERAAWYVHPDGGAQTEEVGRDQGHNFGGWMGMLYLCQMAWNQDDDLFAYDDYRVLRAIEYITKYNLGHEVPFVHHRTCDLNYTETLSENGRGNFGCYFYELVTNHYVRRLGLAAPYSEQAATLTRPEPVPNTSIHPSQADWLGLGTLTFTLDNEVRMAAPRGLHAHWTADGVTLSWLGSNKALGYRVKRAATSGGPYEIIATITSDDLTYTDADVADGAAYYYAVTGFDRRVETDNSAEWIARQELKAFYPFDGDSKNAVVDPASLADVAACLGGSSATLDPLSLCAAADRDGDLDCDLRDFAAFQRCVIAGRSSGDAVLRGGSTGLPTFAAGHNGGQAISLDGVDDYVELPVGVANHQDITVAAWVYWNGGGAWQRIFDFGTEIEKNMFLTPCSGDSTVRFSISTSRGNEGTGELNGPVLPTGAWTHVAVTLGGHTGTLYVNGAAVDTQVIDAVDPLFGQPFCYLGRSMYNADPLFSGRIDDFRIYNHALTAAEVAALAGVAK